MTRGELVTRGERSGIPTGLLVLTDRHLARRPLPEVIGAAVDGGARYVLLRERDLPHVDRLRLANELRRILAPVGGTLLVAGPDPLDGAAVHLTAAGPYPPPPLPLVGRSCHDETELSRLSTEDYVTLSPVFATRTKPGYGPALGPDRLGALIRRSPVPVLALGGIETPDRVAACVDAGAVGVAVLGAVMRADDPAETTATLLTAFARQPPSGHKAGTPETANTHDGAAAGRAHAGIKPDRPEWARPAAALNRATEEPA